MLNKKFKYFRAIALFLVVFTIFCSNPNCVSWPIYSVCCSFPKTLSLWNHLYILEKMTKKKENWKDGVDAHLKRKQEWFGSRFNSYYTIIYKIILSRLLKNIDTHFWLLKFLISNRHKQLGSNFCQNKKISSAQNFIRTIFLS
jgi:hypothetical protein